MRSLLAALALMVTSCAPSMQRESILTAYQSGHLEAAESILDQQVNTQMPGGAYWRSKNAVAILLDKATTEFAAGKIDNAIADYDLSIQALDYYGQDSTLETGSQILFSDTASAYRGSDLEHVLARVYFALALLQKREIANAVAILRQAEDIQQRFCASNTANCTLAAIPCGLNPVAKYLLAVLSDYQGDPSNASILYRQVEEVAGPLATTDKSPGNATVLCVCHNGNVPFKISETACASLASAAALEIFLAANRIEPAFSSFTGIPVPVLCQFPSSAPLPFQITVDTTPLPPPFHFDVAAAASIELEQKTPLIVARGVARFLLRRTAVGCAQKQDPCMGSLIDLGMLLVNANTKADTRSWDTLPSSIDITLFSLSAGCHNLHFTFPNPCGQPYTQTCVVHVRPNELCTINIFAIHPGIVNILIPPHFTSKESTL